MVTLTPKNSGIRPGICRQVALLWQQDPVLLPGSDFLTHCSPLPLAPLSSSWLCLLRQQSFSTRISLCWPLSSFLSLIPTQTKSWMPKEGLYCSLWNLRPFYSKLAMVLFVFYHDFISLKQFLAHSKIKGVEQRFPIYPHPHTYSPGIVPHYQHNPLLSGDISSKNLKGIVPWQPIMLKIERCQS